VFDENAAFVQKPVLPNELLAKIRELLDKQAPAGGGV
jgi:DNA-binding response OmpR family regulator